MGLLTETIRYVGLDGLNQEEKAILNKLSTEYFQKIKRLTKNITSIIVHIKLYNNDGKEDKRKKYSIHVRALAPTRIFESTKAADWDFARTLHKAFNDIEHEIKHKMKIETGRSYRRLREL